MAALATGVWVGRARLLPALGVALAVEDPITPVDVIIASTATARADTIEAAALYHAGVARRIVLPFWQPDAVDIEVQRLGVPWLAPTELALAILERSNVPREVIHVLQDPVDGLNAEITSIGRFANTHHPRSILFITARSHSRRARLLLRRALPSDTTIHIRTARGDPFDPQTWWYTRAGAREVAMEYLRWANTFMFDDPWGSVPPTPKEAR